MKTAVLRDIYNASNMVKMKKFHDTKNAYATEKDDQT